MDQQKISHSYSHLFIGLLMILIGVVALLDNFDVIDAWEIFRFWPVLLILFGYLRMSHAMSGGGRTIGLLFITLGILLLLDKIYYFHFHFWDWWPVIIIVIGGGLLINSLSLRRGIVAAGSAGSAPADPESVINLFAFISGLKRICSSQEFLGGEIGAVMGGCEVDLRQAKIRDGSAVINLFVFWGGITIKVPREWNIVVAGMPILGGINDKTHPENPQSRLVIRGQVIMGGAEIVN